MGGRLEDGLEIHLQRKLLMYLTFTNIAMVGLGGMAGSVFRFVIGSIIMHRYPGRFPWGTFSVNIIGSLLIGIFLGWAAKQQHADFWKLLLATGFCGGFTTFSTLSYEGFLLIKQQQFGILALYISATLVLGLVATALGFIITK
jgi:fluoride exporter